MSHFSFLALALIYNLFLISVIIIVILYGGKEEKSGTFVILIGSIFSALSTHFRVDPFEGVEIGILIVDCAVLFIFLNMASISRRFWPIWASSFQLSAILTHLSDYLIGKPIAVAYALLQGFFAYPIMICILLATYGHQRAVRSEQR